LLPGQENTQVLGEKFLVLLDIRRKPDTKLRPKITFYVISLLLSE